MTVTRSGSGSASGTVFVCVCVDRIRFPTAWRPRQRAPRRRYFFFAATTTGVSKISMRRFAALPFGFAFVATGRYCE